MYHFFQIYQTKQWIGNKTWSDYRDRRNTTYKVDTTVIREAGSITKQFPQTRQVRTRKYGRHFIARSGLPANLPPPSARSHVRVRKEKRRAAKTNDRLSATTSSSGYVLFPLRSSPKNHLQLFEIKQFILHKMNKFCI